MRWAYKVISVSMFVSRMELQIVFSDCPSEILDMFTFPGSSAPGLEKSSN